MLPPLPSLSIGADPDRIGRPRLVFLVIILPGRGPLVSMQLLFNAFLAIGRSYFTWQSATFGLMTMSYFGRDSDRCSPASHALISFAVKPTPVGYTPSMQPTAG